MEAPKKKSRLIAEMLETAQGLHQAGLIDQRRMKKLNAFSNLETESMGPEQIKTLRRKANVSQSVLATLLNTSVSTVQKWEVGDKKPSGPSLKLLRLIESKGIDVVM